SLVGALAARLAAGPGPARGRRRPAGALGAGRHLRGVCRLVPCPVPDRLLERPPTEASLRRLAQRLRQPLGRLRLPPEVAPGAEPPGAEGLFVAVLKDCRVEVAQEYPAGAPFASPLLLRRVREANPAVCTEVRAEIGRWAGAAGGGRG
ncbi:MAG: hypothetical protein ACYDA8_13795, partial [Deferrisomatales bacterium]